MPEGQLSLGFVSEFWFCSLYTAALPGPYFLAYFPSPIIPGQTFAKKKTEIDKKKFLAQSYLHRLFSPCAPALVSGVILMTV